MLSYPETWSPTIPDEVKLDIDPWTSNLHGEVGLRSLVSTFCLFSQLVCRLNNLRLVWPAEPFVIYPPSVLMDLYYGLNLLPCFSLLANAVMLFLPRIQCYMDFEYMLFSTNYFEQVLAWSVAQAQRAVHSATPGSKPGTHRISV
jgi:hypothetical protein